MNTAPILYDWLNKPVASTAAPLTNRPATALSSPQGGVMVLGSDYASSPSAQVPRVDASGNLYTSSSATGPTGATAASTLRTLLLTGSGTSATSTMIVNGASTNVVFSWTPPTTTSSYIVTGINFVISAASVIMQGKYWMALSGGLTNGVLVAASSGGTYTTLATLKINEDFLAYTNQPVISLIGSTDYIQARVSFMQPIAVNSGDGVRVTIRDNLATNNGGGLLTSGTANLYYMVAYVEGIRLTA